MSAAPPPQDIRAHPERWAFFLDIDGTLLDLAPAPESVRIPTGLTPLLLALQAQFGGALALNTGRELAIVDRMMAPVRFAAAGVHGTELRSHPDGEVARLAPALPQALLAEVQAAAFTLDPNLMVEDKTVGLAVHYRHVPDCETRLEHTLAHIVAAWPHVELRPGRKVWEMVPRGLTKATAIAHFLEQPPFRGRRPVVIGDDIGDEPALAYARDRGGVALTVAGGHVPRTAATFKDTSSVRAWLEEITDGVEAAPLEAHGPQRSAPLSQR